MVAAVRTTPEQTQAALGRAFAVKEARTVLKLHVKAQGRAGALEIADTVLSAPREVARMYVWQLVRWVPQIADATTARLLRTAGIDPWARVGRLSQRQRVGLAAGLCEHAAGRSPCGYKRKPVIVDQGIPQRTNNGPTCCVCGEHLRRPGLCGWCEAEASGGVS